MAYGSAYANGLRINNENRARKVDGNSNLKLGEPETPVKLRGDQAKSPRDSDPTRMDPMAARHWHAKAEISQGI